MIRRIVFGRFQHGVGRGRPGGYSVCLLAPVTGRFWQSRPVCRRYHRLAPAGPLVIRIQERIGGNRNRAVLIVFLLFLTVFLALFAFLVPTSSPRHRGW